MKVVLGAAVAVTGASALIYILLRSRKRHPDPGKQDDSTAIHSENVNPNKTSEEEAKLSTDKINASCSDMSCESKDSEDTNVNKYPYVNFNGHVPINGKNSEEILDDHVTDHINEINVSVKENCVVEQHAEVCGENVAEVEVKQSSVDASSRQYPRMCESNTSLFDKVVSVTGLLDNSERSSFTYGKTDDLVHMKKSQDGQVLGNTETGMAYSSIVPLELSDVLEKDGPTEPCVSQNLKENENISMNMVKEDIISNTTVPEKFSAKPVTLGMEKVTHMSCEITEDEGCSSLIIPQEKESLLGSFLEYDCHTTTVLAKEEKEPMRGSSVQSVSLEKPALSTSGVNEESNVMFDPEQKHELTTSLKLQGEKPPVLPSPGKKQALTDLCDFVFEKDSSVSFTIDRDQESVTFPGLDLNKEYTCLPDIPQRDLLGSSLSFQDEKSTESLLLHKEGESYFSSSFEHEKHSTVSSSLEDEKQSSVSSNLEQEEQSSLSSNLAIEEGSTLSFDMDHEEKANEHSLHFSSVDHRQQLVLSPILPKKEGSSLSLDQEERSLSSNLDKEEHCTPSNLDREEQFNLSSTKAIEEHTTLRHKLDYEKQYTVSSCLDQLKQSTLSPILAQEEGSTLSSSMDQEEQSSLDQEEHYTLSSTMILKQQSSPLSSFDQEEHCNLSSSTGITCRLGKEEQSNLSFCMYQEQTPLSLGITSKEGSTVLLDQKDRCSHSSSLNQVEQISVSSNFNPEEQSTILFNEQEHVTCSSSKKHEEQPYLSSTLDQEKECALSFNLAQEEAVNLTQEEGFVNLVQQEESPIVAKKEQSVVLPSLVIKEQSTLSTSLDQNQESNFLLRESDKLCAQAQETSKDICLKSAKVKKEDCQKNSVLQKEKEIKSTSSECLTKEIVTINSKKDNTDLHQKASEQEEEEKMADRTQNASMKISTLKESSSIGTSGSGELFSTTTEMLRESSSTGTPELRGVCNTESSKVKESNCTSICMKESSAGIDNLKESSSTGTGNSKESNITDTHKLKESNNAGISKLRESSNTAPNKLRDGNVVGTCDLEESSTLKKTAMSDKGTLRKQQFQENQGGSAAADLDHDSTSEQENVNSDSLSVKSFDSSEIEPETLFNPSTFPVSSQEQYIFYEFEIPQTLVGRLIGRKGAFVNKVKAATDATVIVYPHKNRRLKLCSVEGTKQQVRAALDMIREHFPQNRYPDVTLTQVSTQQSVLAPAQPTLNTQAMQIELTAGVVVEVRVSAVVSAGELWVQQPLHPSYSALHRLQSCMNLNYGDGSNTPPLPSPVQDGTVCVAQIKNHWLRCQVLSTEDDISLVVLLDVGGTVSIATSLLRQIRYDYMTLPFQASQCFLHGVQPAKDDVWDDVSVAVMEEFVSDTILFATVVSYTEDGVPLVSLYRRDQDQYVHLNEKLVLLGHAQWVSPQPAS